MFKSFFQDQQGHVAVITALVILPLITLAGASLDLMNANRVQEKIAASVDTAVLAAANLKSSEDIEIWVESFVNANVPISNLTEDGISVKVHIDQSFNSRGVTVVATGKVPLMFMPIIGVSEMQVSAEATAYQEKSNIEIALVLDISSSMNGNRLTNLKSASADFVDQILTDDTKATTSISIVPFGGTVNIGSLFDDYVVPLSIADVDPSESDYDIGSSVNSAKFRFSDGDKCLESTLADYDDELIPTKSRGQVPHFWRWWNFHPWCPTDDSAVDLNSNDADSLKSHLSGMTLSDGTGMDVGAMWGLKALSPDYRGKLGGHFSTRPLDYKLDDSKKVLIIMTDGDITQQNRPEDFSRNNTHTNRSYNAPADGDGYSNQGNNKNLQTTLSKGNSSHTASNDSAVGRFKKICDQAHDEDIVVYTIGFQIKTGNLSDDLLQYCASSSSNYYHVESLDISAAFRAIASSVQALRITR